MKSKLVLAVIFSFGLTGCVQYASGYKKTGGGGGASADGEAAGEEGDVAEGGEEGAACLKLAQKRKKNLKLLDEGETAEPETEEEVAACETEEGADAGTEEEAPADEEVTE